MPKLDIDIFAIIFLDHFYFMTAIWLILLGSLASRKLFHFGYPYAIAISSWLFLVVGAIVVASILAIDFFFASERAGSFNSCSGYPWGLSFIWLRYFSVIVLPQKMKTAKFNSAALFFDGRANPTSLSLARQIERISLCSQLMPSVRAAASSRVRCIVNTHSRSLEFWFAPLDKRFA